MSVRWEERGVGQAGQWSSVPATCAWDKNNVSSVQGSQLLTCAESVASSLIPRPPRPAFVTCSTASDKSWAWKPGNEAKWHACSSPIRV